MGEWRCSAGEQKPRVVFLGPPGQLQARVFRGAIGREMALGLRALEVPTLTRQMQPGWDVEIPPRWAQRENAVARRLMVFRSPIRVNGLGETVLEFESAIPPSLEQAILAIFLRKEQSHGSQEHVEQRSSEAEREAQPLPQGDEPAGAGDGAQHRHPAGQQDQPEGQPLTTAPAAPVAAQAAAAGGGAKAVTEQPANVPDWLRKTMNRVARQAARRRRRGRRR